MSPMASTRRLGCSRSRITLLLLVGEQGAGLHDGTSWHMDGSVPTEHAIFVDAHIVMRAIGNQLLRDLTQRHVLSFESAHPFGLVLILIRHGLGLLVGEQGAGLRDGAIFCVRRVLSSHIGLLFAEVAATPHIEPIIDALPGYPTRDLPPNRILL